MRLTHQFYMSGGKGTFLTLTYDDEHLPEGATLVKSDVQNFMKRLRKSIGKKFKIKYYACGEYGEKAGLERRYGDQHGRPHYHIIIIGLHYGDASHRKLIDSAWNLGRVYHGTFSSDSARYTADYIQKKMISKDPEKIREEYGHKLPPFQLQSQGIGWDYAKAMAEDILSTGKIKSRGKETSIPRYYLKKLGKYNIDTEAALKNRREAIQKICKHYDVETYDEVMHKIFGVGSLFMTDYPLERFVKDNKQKNVNNIAKRNLFKRDKTERLYLTK